MPFKPTYLYIKTHSITGLKYFGKTTKSDPSKYTGSGDYWLKHINVHGNHLHTEILGFFTDKDECIRAATEFSINNNIVESKEWANFKIENGLDGGSDIGHKKSNTENMRIAASIKAQKMIDNGTHPFLGERGSELAKKRNKKLIEEGKHNFQGEKGSRHSTEMNLKRVKEGTHNLIRRADGTSHASDRVANGTHNWQSNAHTVSVVDKLGNCIRVTKDLYWSQIGPKEDWEYVGISSKIAKTRLTKT
jgi:hypothetical protein